MATVGLWDNYRIRVELCQPRPKRRLGINYINLELPPFQRETPQDLYHDQYDSLSDDSDVELQFSDDEYDDRYIYAAYPPRSANSRRQTPTRRLNTAIGDCLLLSTSDAQRNSDIGVRWTTSAKGRRPRSCDPRWRLSYSAPSKDRVKLAYLSKDGKVHENDPSEQQGARPELSTKIPVHLHPHSMHDILVATERAWGISPDERPQTTAVSRSTDNRKQRCRRSTVSRRPHTVAPAMPTSSSASTAAYISDRVRYLLEARASITPNVLKEEILPLLEEHHKDSSLALTDADLEEGGITLPSKAVLTGKECRRFRKRVLNFIRKRRVLKRFENIPKTDAFIRFKTAGRIVATLIRMRKAIIANTDDLTLKSAAEVQWKALYSDSDPHKLAFNASVFTRERAIEKLPMWSLDILRKDPEIRTDSDCRKLHTLLKGMRCYDKFTEKIQFSLCKTFSLMCFQEGRVIIRQGHVGQNFYMIYSGSVFVNVNDKSPSGHKFVKNEAILSKGDSFGEMALLQDIRRTATIVVRETCELLVVQKTVFSEVCPRIFEIELEEKQMFMNKMLLFSSRWWTEEALKNLALTAQIQEYKTNKVIVTDSVREDWIYVCLEGKCQVIRCLEMNKKKPEKPFLSSRRRSMVLLSNEILDLLGSFPETSVAEIEKTRRQSRLKTPDSTKEKLLGSLGLDYVDTGRRQKAFIAEMEQAEQKKALEAARGHMTLTSFMRHKLQKTASDLVFLHVDVVNPMEIFDLSCVLSPYHRLGNCSFMLVSGGARLLRIRRDHFHDYASTAALEYTKNQAFKERYPSDEVLLKSYKEKSGWEAFKGSVVRDVKSSRQIVQDRRRFYRKESKVKDRQSQIWTFVIDSKIVELKTLPKKIQLERPEPSAAVARAWAHDHRPEVVRTVPETIVMRRRSSVRFSPDMPLISRQKAPKSDRTNETISEDEEMPEFNKGKRRSVTIKLPDEHSD